MKRIVVILILGFIFSTVRAQMDNPLREGMPNTVKLPSGEVIYDLNGEWDAVYDSGGWGMYNDIVKITQKDNQFVGVYMLKGDNLVDKNKVARVLDYPSVAEVAITEVATELKNLHNNKLAAIGGLNELKALIQQGQYSKLNSKINKIITSSH